MAQEEVASGRQDLHVASAELYVPPLEDLAKQLQQVLSTAYAQVECSVLQECPDLIDAGWGVAAPGITGDNQLIEVGGLPNLLVPERRASGSRWTLPEVVRACGLRDDVYLTGAGAASSRVVGQNAELVPCEHLGVGTRKSCYAAVDMETGKDRLGEYDSDEFDLMVNLMASRGERGPVLKVVAGQRTKQDTNFVSVIRQGLTAAAGDRLDRHVGLGGVFKVLDGTVRAHVMPLFPDGALKPGQGVTDWLKFFDMDAGMVCCTTLVSGDPTGGELHLRLEHTHFFDRAAGRGGHYHFSTTPETERYEAYFMPCRAIHRVEDPYRGGGDIDWGGL